jgi:hypothetical protein
MAYLTILLQQWQLNSQKKVIYQDNGCVKNLVGLFSLLPSHKCTNIALKSGELKFLYNLPPNMLNFATYVA